jgi:hypothetical protein
VKSVAMIQRRRFGRSSCQQRREEKSNGIHARMRFPKEAGPPRLSREQGPRDEKEETDPGRGESAPTTARVRCDGICGEVISRSIRRSFAKEPFLTANT